MAATSIKNLRVASMMAGVLLALLPPSPVHAQQAPRPNCVAVTKQEYDNARKSRLQQHRFGAYVRTGRVLKRYYWFCPP
jgi:hypothetical protein